MSSPKTFRWLPATLLLVALGLQAGCGDDCPTAPEPPVPAKILVLSDAGTQGHVLFVLAKAGFDDVEGPLYYEFDGTGLEEYDAVLLLNGVDYGYAIPDSTQARLVRYVENGGGLLTIEWLLYEDNNPILTEILPAEYGGDYDYAPDDYTRALDHPVSAGLPDVFTTPEDWSAVQLAAVSDSTKAPEVIFHSTIAGDAVVVGRYGAGRTLCWGMAGEYHGTKIWDANVDKLLVNAVRWLAGG